MSVAFLAKKRLTALPYPMGWLLAHIPYAYRPGAARTYRLRQRQIRAMEQAPLEVKQQFVVVRVRQIVTFAVANVPFYRDLYRGFGITPEDIRSFEDLQQLPILTKSVLQSVPLEDRSSQVGSRSLANTGGSSGQPLEFYIEPASIPHEWAHMHDVWQRVGYRQGTPRIVFGGRSGISDAIRYDSARHQWNVDIQKPWSVIADRLRELLERHAVGFLHGYPSAIFDFVLWAQETEHPVHPRLVSHVRGLLLGSEHPSPALRQQVESTLACESVSWYGHTERAVLAGEREHAGRYRPFLTYGFAEAVDSELGHRLVATNYYNRASPLIRYDTGDLVDPYVSDGMLEEFSIGKGREGEFILDARGNKVFLTGLIFGRHHGLFGLVRHIQVRQTVPGRASIIVVPRGRFSAEEVATEFDASGIDIDFAFMCVEKPYRNVSGKVALLLD